MPPELATLLERTSDLVWSATPDGRLLYLNLGGRRLLGWASQASVEGKRLSDLHPAWAIERFSELALPHALEHGSWSGESAVLSSGGVEIPVSQVLVVHRGTSGEPTRVSGIARDIRELKAVEARLCESTKMFQLVMDYIPQHVFWKDQNSVFLGCNANFARVAGMASPADIVGKTDFDLAWKPEESAFFQEVDRRVMSNDQPELHIIEPQLQADGKQAWLDTSKIPLHDESGRVVGLLGTFEDITERKEAENEMVEREEKLRTILDSIGDAVIATDARGNVTRMNPVAEQLTGWSGEEAQGERLDLVFAVHPSETSEPLTRPFEKLLEVGRLAKPSEALTLRTREGRECLISERATPMRDQAGELTGLVVVFRDVTEQRALEEQLRHARKMESIGRLAGGVAHDFNNMLAAIAGFAELVRRKGSDPDIAHYAANIIDVSENAAALTQKLLDFSRKGVHHRRPYAVHGAVEAVRALLARTIDRRIAIELDLDATHHWVVGDPAQLQNALLNLGLNARDAMPEGGTIAIRTADVQLDPAACDGSAFELVPGPHLELTLSDTGTGMEEAVLRRAFEPYFTTKGPGAGTGLGLPSVYNAVLDHGGAIHAASRPGEGTEFRLLLPVSADESDESRDDSQAEEIVMGSGTLMLVDDEPAVRGSVAELLQRLGYDVVDFADGAPAVEYLRQRPGSIDLAILDMVTPGLGGRALLAALREVEPGLPVVFTSGFTREEGAFDDTGVVGFLKKPFRVTELASVVARAIASRADRS